MLHRLAARLDKSYPIAIASEVASEVASKFALVFALVIVLTACGGSTSDVAGDAKLSAGADTGLASQPAALSEPAATGYLLSVSAQGGGHVRSSPSGIDCGTNCAATLERGAIVTLAAAADAGFQFRAWSGACTGSGACTVTMEQAKSVVANFSPLMGTGFNERPFVFKSVEARLRASIAANDAVANGTSNNATGSSIGFLTLARAAASARSAYADIPTFQLAFAGWLLNDSALLIRARDEAMQIVAAAPNGDNGTGEHFQHIEERMLNVAATADLAHTQFSATQLAQVAAWVNGTLTNWNTQNLRYWPLDSPKNNYWQNGFLAHVIGGIASEGFNPQAAGWRTTALLMAQKFRAATTAPAWIGPVQSEGHYYAGYVKQALWAMELYDGAMGTSLIADSNFHFAENLNLLMYQTRSHLNQFFAVGSEAAQSDAPFTQLSMEHWHQLIFQGRASSEAAQAKRVLTTAMSNTLWSRASKGFTNFYWNLGVVPNALSSEKLDRLFVAPTPGAGLIGLRSQAGFAPEARAALMFANKQNAAPDYSHANPDAPGFQWTSGADWLVTDPDVFANSGILAEAGSNVGSDVSNIVTLEGHKTSEVGDFPVIRFAEHKPGASVPHTYVQIDAQPYWTAASVYRRDYVWLDDLQVVVIFDRIVGAPAKTWRLHLPAAPTINGNLVQYSINGNSVVVRNVYSSSAGAWSAQNLNGSLTQRDVWRLTQTDSSEDYRSLKVIDLGARVSAATAAAGAGYLEARLTVAGSLRVFRFFDDGAHADIR